METLTIPLKLDSAQTMAKLKALQEQGAKTGEALDEGAKQGQKGLDAATGSAGELATGLNLVLGITGGLGSLHGAMMSIVGTLKEGAEHAAKMAREFGDYRRMVLELAGVQGKAPSDQFTLEQAKQANLAQMDPTKFAGYQLALQQEIAGNVGPGKQLTQEQFDRINQTTAAFGASRNISPEAIATLTGGLTRATQGGPDADKQILERFGKLINLMDASPGKVELLLPELNEVLATGASPEEAGAMISVMAGRGRPREAGTYARALQRSISELMQKVQTGKAPQDFGITPEMTDIEAANQIYKAAQAEQVDMASPRAMRMWLSQQGFTAEEEQQALMASFNLGFKTPGFANAQATIQAGGRGAVDESITRFRESTEGQQQAAEARTAFERLQIGARQSEFRLAQERARGAYQERLAHPGPKDIAADWATPDFIFGNREELAVNRAALRAMEQRAIQAGVPKTELPFQGGFVPPVAPGAAAGYGEQILERIARAVEAGNQDRKAGMQRDQQRPIGPRPAPQPAARQ